MPKITPPHPSSVAATRNILDSSYSLTKPAKFVLIMLLAQMNARAAGDKDSPVFVVTASHYRELFGCDESDSRKLLKKACKELHDSNVVFYTDDQDYDVKEAKWLTLVEYTNRRTVNASMRLTVHPLVMPLLHNLERGFSKYNVKDIIRLSSSNQIRLYEDCVLWRMSSSKKWSTTMDDFARRYQLSKNLMSRPSEFKRSFLEPAVKAINESTPLLITYDDNGRNFQFTIEPNPHYKKPQ